MNTPTESLENVVAPERFAFIPMEKYIYAPFHCTFIVTEKYICARFRC